MSLEEIKEEVINNTSYDDYADFKFEIIVGSIHPDSIESIYLRIAERYAQQRVNEVLDKAAESAQMIMHDGHHKTNSYVKHVQVGANNIQVDKQSILKLKNNA